MFRNDITTYDRTKDVEELEKWKLEYKQNGGEENSRVFKDIRNSYEIFFGKAPTEVKKGNYEIIKIRLTENYYTV